MSSAGVINQVLTAPKFRTRDIHTMSKTHTCTHSHTHACTQAHTCTLALKKYSKQVQKNEEDVGLGVVLKI